MFIYCSFIFPHKFIYGTYISYVCKAYKVSKFHAESPITDEAL